MYHVDVQQTSSSATAQPEYEQVQSANKMTAVSSLHIVTDRKELNNTATNSTISTSSRLISSYDNPVLLSSPSSDSSDADSVSRPTCPSSSSIDGSSRPGSDKFLLAGEFSSYDSDAFISATTGSSDNEPTSSQPLSELRNLIDKNGPVKHKRHSAPVIILSDSSDFDTSVSERPPKSKEQSVSFSSSVVLNKCPLSVSNSHPPLPTLKVHIPLNQVTVSSPSSSSSINRNTKGKRPIALSHFATTKKRVENNRKRTHSSDSSDEDFFVPEVDSSFSLKSPLSLKLRKSGNYWQSILEHNGESSSHISSALSSNGNIALSSTPKDLSPKKKGSNSHKKSPTKSLKHKKTSPNKALPIQNPPSLLGTLNSNISVNTENEFHTGSTIDHLIDTGTCESVASMSELGCDMMTCHPPFTKKLSKFKDNEDDTLSVMSGSSLTTSSTNGSTTQHPVKPTRGRPPKRRYHHQQSKPISIKNIKSTICFEKLFSFHPPNLILVDGDLHPAQSLSLKNVDLIPDNHPIHTWKLGRSVPKPRKKPTSQSKDDVDPEYRPP